MDVELLAQSLDLNLAVLADLAGLCGNKVRTTNEVSNKNTGRVQVDLFGGIHLFDSSRIHHDNAVGHCHCFGLIVRHVHGGNPQTLLHPTNLHAHLHAKLCVQVRQRLIEEQNLRAHDHRSGQCNTLLLAAGKLGRSAICHRGEVHCRKCNINLFLDFRCALLTQMKAVCHVLTHAQVREQCVGLEHHGHGALVRRNNHHVFAIEHDLARSRIFEARDHTQGRGLATARGSQKGDEFTGVNIQVDVINRGDLGSGVREGLGQLHQGQAAGSICVIRIRHGSFLCQQLHARAIGGGDRFISNKNIC